jgi:transcriptional regulator with XRE-family HTH domain
MKAAAWIDRVKVARGWESDYRAAQELGVARATVSKYRSRDSTLDEDTAVRVAAALGQPAEIILIDQAAERSKNIEVRSALARVLALLGGGGPAGGDQAGKRATRKAREPGAAVLNITKSASSGDEIYIVSSGARWWHRIACALAPQGTAPACA